MSPGETLRLRSIMEDWCGSVRTKEWMQSMRDLGCVFHDLGCKRHACDMFNSHDSNMYVAIEIEQLNPEMCVMLVPNEFANKVLVLGPSR